MINGGVKEDNIITTSLAENIMDTLKRKKKLDYDTYQVILNKVKAAHLDVKDAHPDEGDDGSPSTNADEKEQHNAEASNADEEEQCNIVFLCRFC